MNTKYIRRDAKIDFSGPFTSPKVLPSGVYASGQNMDGSPYLEAWDVQTEDLVRLKDSKMSEIYDYINNFLDDKVREGFRKYGLLYKRGVLLYGPPGTGKTSLVNQLISLCAREKDMIILLNPYPGLVRAIVQAVRTVEQNNRPFMIIWEEFENWALSCEGDVLNLLDGVSQIDNVLYLATTNYIEKIPERIKNRPSRFADVVEIGLPSAAARHAFLKAKIHVSDKVNIDEWVSRTEGLSIDHLKDLIVSVLVIGTSFDVALNKIKVLSSENLKSYQEPYVNIAKAESGSLNKAPSAAPLMERLVKVS